MVVENEVDDAEDHDRTDDPCADPVDELVLSRHAQETAQPPWA
jgi:hypothetical protein